MPSRCNWSSKCPLNITECDSTTFTGRKFQVSDILCAKETHTSQILFETPSSHFNPMPLAFHKLPGENMLTLCTNCAPYILDQIIPRPPSCILSNHSLLLRSFNPGHILVNLLYTVSNTTRSLRVCGEQSCTNKEVRSLSLYFVKLLHDFIFSAPSYCMKASMPNAIFTTLSTCVATFIQRWM